MLRDVLQHQALSISCCFYPHALLTKPGWGSPWMFWFTHNLCRGSQVIMTLPKLRNNVRPATDLISYLRWSRTWVWWSDLLILKVFSNFKNLKKPKPLVAVGLDHRQAPLALLTTDWEMGRVLHPPACSGVCFHLCCTSHPYCHLCSSLPNEAASISFCCAG